MGEAFFSRVVDSRGGVSDLEMNHSTSPRPAEMHTEERMVKNCNYDCIWILNVIYVVSYFLYIWNASLLFSHHFQLLRRCNMSFSSEISKTLSHLKPACLMQGFHLKSELVIHYLRLGRTKRIKTVVTKQQHPGLFFLFFFFFCLKYSDILQILWIY